MSDDFPEGYDPYKPATYLTPGELAEVDQIEADVRDVAEKAIEMMKGIEVESGPQSLGVWAILLTHQVDADTLGALAAYYMLKEARRAPSEAA